MLLAAPYDSARLQTGFAGHSGNNPRYDGGPSVHRPSARAGVSLIAALDRNSGRIEVRINGRRKLQEVAARRIRIGVAHQMSPTNALGNVACRSCTTSLPRECSGMSCYGSGPHSSRHMLPQSCGACRIPIACELITRSVPEPAPHKWRANARPYNLRRRVAVPP